MRPTRSRESKGSLLPMSEAPRLQSEFIDVKHHPDHDISSVPPAGIEPATHGLGKLLHRCRQASFSSSPGAPERPCGTMAPRGEAVLTVTFGPTQALTLPRAIAYAMQHAEDLTEVAAGVWRATLRLGTGDAEPYGRALRLICMVYGWRSTDVEVQGAPEYTAVVRIMLDCARRWLRGTGACRAIFPGGPFSKCTVCPLYDPGWAMESWARPSPATFVDMEDQLEFRVPDYVPEDWLE
jgi:hypothetical protein